MRRAPRLVGLCILFSPFLAMGRPPGTRHARFQHVSWNVQTLANATSTRRARQKLSSLACHLKDVDVFFLQEVHGDDQYVIDLMRPLSDKFAFEYSATANEISGGVLTAWSKAWAGTATVQHAPIVPGRVLISTFRFQDTELRFGSVHNFGITNAQSQDIHNRMAADWDWMSARPEQRAALWSGDWNIGLPDWIATTWNAQSFHVPGYPVTFPEPSTTFRKVWTA